MWHARRRLRPAYGTGIVNRSGRWGEGIAAFKLHTIFERFHRADGADGRGHGLGLFIASAITRLHGGTLVANSEVGKGSTFSLRLPFNR